VIEARGLTKRFGARTAVDDLTVTVRPGVVTGFLGPNGAGKSTTLRLILGLDHPTAGTVTVGGRSYRESPAPMHEVGALLEARAVHPRRTARSHLRVLAATHGIPDRRVDEVLDLVGLADVAGQRVRTFSLGMGQRLGIAVAMLGNPATLLLDEPINGLDPEGIRWIRALLAHLAGEGRTVLVSSHLMTEVALTADRAIVIGRGRLIADAPVAELTTRGAVSTLVRSPDPRLPDVLQGAGLPAGQFRPDGGYVVPAAAAAVGDAAGAAGVVLHELTPIQASLEDVFMQLTAETVDYRSAVA
jgi:ABC-2 type transport system ATP-binding protein